MRNAPAYVIVSLVFFIIIGIGFAYSYFFYPNAHPVNCIIKAYTGKDCPTCGFSRAFSYYVHGDIELGKTFNALSWRPFLFLAFQYLVRGIIISVYFKTHKQFKPFIIFSDVIISISFFLLAFLPIILKF